MTPHDDIVVVGRITGVFGVKGWVKVASFTDPADNLVSYRPWLLGEAGQWNAVAVEEIASRSKGWIARFDGCTDRDAAALLAGTDIGVPRGVLPEPAEDEFYWSDLTGCAVETIDGRVLGAVERMMSTGANDVMVIRDEARERLVPFTAEVVPTVDIVARRIVVDWDPEF